MKNSILLLFISVLFNQAAIGQLNSEQSTKDLLEAREKMNWEWSFHAAANNESIREALNLPVANVDYDGFMELSNQVYEYRKERLVDLETFIQMSKEANTIILDTRSESAYKQIHLAGAVHLNFSDFTEEKLARTILSKGTRILIYCNNNFQGTPYYFPSKTVKLALNIPTFINLYGYGYQNIYELNDLLPFPTDLVNFEGEYFPKN